MSSNAPPPPPAPRPRQTRQKRDVSKLSTDSNKNSLVLTIAEALARKYCEGGKQLPSECNMERKMIAIEILSKLFKATPAGVQELEIKLRSSWKNRFVQRKRPLGQVQVSKLVSDLKAYVPV